MSTEVRCLTEEGLAAFRQYLADARADATLSPPAIATEERYARVVTPVASIDASLLFRDKMTFAKYLVGALRSLCTSGELDNDVGMWSWLALAFFDTICPVKGGQRKVGQEHRYVLSHDYQNHYRHLVRTPCRVYGLHGDLGRVLLSGPPDRHGEASEQIVSRQLLFSNKELFRALDALYVEDKEGHWRLRLGAGGKGPGSLRRLGKVIRQFDLTFDLYAMCADRILDLLPAEFSRFRAR